jgi:hypothetical protein
MADIKQAAKWMQKGKQVRRSQWAQLRLKAAIGAEKDFVDRGICRGTVIDAVMPRINDPLEIDDLLADDWELAD